MSWHFDKKIEQLLFEAYQEDKMLFREFSQIKRAVNSQNFFSFNQRRWFLLWDILGSCEDRTEYEEALYNFAGVNFKALAEISEKLDKDLLQNSPEAK